VDFMVELGIVATLREVVLRGVAELHWQQVAALTGFLLALGALLRFGDLQKGRLAESIAKLEKAVSLSGGSHFRALLARGHALAGDSTKARNILHELKTLSQREYVSPFDFAVIYAGLGDRDSAFQWLEEAYQQRVFRIIELTLPMFDDLRPDARWRDLVRRIGLPQ
jgi:hypothetical protein